MNETTEFTGRKDPLYRQSVELIIESKRISPSYVQRRLKISYRRAELLCSAVIESLMTKSSDHIATSGKMITLTAEAAQQIEEAFENAESVAASINAGKHHVIQVDDEKCFWQREEWVRWAIDEVLPEIREALSAIRAARAHEQNPVAWYDKIKGMEVSVDVSTGEDDDYNRIFGRVDGVMLQSCGAQEDTILVIEDSRNFDAPQPVKQEPVSGVRCKLIESCKSCQHSFGRKSCALAERDFDSIERTSTPPEWCPLPLYARPVQQIEFKYCIDPIVDARNGEGK